MLKIFFLCAGILGLAGRAWAAELKGEVSEVRSASNQIVITDSASGLKHTIGVHPTIASELKVGSVVSVTLQDGSNNADTVSVEVL